MGFLEWGDMYKRIDALGFTSYEDAVHRSSRLASSPFPLYDIREELFERDEDTYLEMIGNDRQVSTGDFVYTTYAPSHQNPSFSLNINGISKDDDEEICFPSYDDVKRNDKVESVGSPVKTAQASQRPVSPDPVERSEDDSAVQVQPSRHVDYLAHDWVEEDIWASWKHIVSKRGTYNNSARLENASWRSWAKQRFNLRTVPPETVKWMKDHDFTWLYGPLTPGSSSSSFSSLGEAYMPNNKGRRMSRAEIARHSRKPILKKRTLSEIMLRRSISSSLLLKQAAESKEGKDSLRSSTPLESTALTRCDTDSTSVKSTSGSGESSDGWKKVQFHDRVEQCIALVNAGDDDHECEYCSDSDEDVIEIREAKKRATGQSLPSIESNTKTAVSRTIEKLPHVPLKDIEVLETPEEDMTERLSDSQSTSASSQLDTSATTSIEQDSDEEDDMDWQPPPSLQARKDSVQISKNKMSDFEIHHDETTQRKKPPLRPQLERRDASTEAQYVSPPVAPLKGGFEGSIRFDLAVAQSQQSAVSLQTPRYERPRSECSMLSPGMTEGVSDHIDLARSATQLNVSSDNTESPAPVLDTFRRILVDRVMSEFWALFNQQWDKYSQGNALSPLSPADTTTASSVRKRRRGSRKQRAEKPSYFDSSPGNGPSSPDSKELAQYECYIHRELPRAVHRSIEEAVRCESQPREAQLIGNLVNIIHDCEDKLFQSYFDETNLVMKSLGIHSVEPFTSSTGPKASSLHHSEILDAAFHQPPTQHIGDYRSSLRSSPEPSAPQSPSSVTPTTPRDTIFSKSAILSEVATTIPSPDSTRRDAHVSKWPSPEETRIKDGRSLYENDFYDYDEIDEAIAWAKVY